MLFNFELLPVEDVAPWTGASGDDKHLHWFGLTDGFYWLDTGVGKLFRYSDTILAHWADDRPRVSGDEHANYYVVRLWEDILQILPAVLEALPDDLAACVRPGGLWEDWAAWKRWANRGQDWMDTPAGEEGWEVFYAASYWWWERKLDAGYLTSGPGIWLWRERDAIHIQWDNRGILIDDIPAWSSAAGRATLSVPDFIAEVRFFNDRLIGQMAERIEAIQRHWSRPEIHIDLQGLVKDHRHRSTLLDSALAQTPQTDWDAARTALSEMERHLKAT